MWAVEYYGDVTTLGTKHADAILKYGKQVTRICGHGGGNPIYRVITTQSGV
jgi:hypothetical protein